MRIRGERNGPVHVTRSARAEAEHVIRGEGEIRADGDDSCSDGRF
jgi:hypothetical protein